MRMTHHQKLQEEDKLKNEATRMDVSKCKIIVLDFDGTIVDSMPWLEQIAVKVMSKYMKEPIEVLRRKYRDTTGLPFEQQVELIWPRHPQNHAMVAEFEETKKEHFNSQKLFEDTVTTLEYLKGKGYKVALSSGTYEHIMESYLASRNITHLFDDTLGFRPGFEKGKDHFNFLMNKYGCSSKELVFVGDSLNDARRAFNCNIPFIAKLGLFSKEDFLKINGSMAFIHRLDELRQFL